MEVPEVPPGKIPASASARLPAPTSSFVSAAMLAATALTSRKANSAIGERTAGVSSSQLSLSPTSMSSSLLCPDQADPSPIGLSCTISEASPMRPGWVDWFGCFRGKMMPADPICCVRNSSRGYVGRQEPCHRAPSFAIFKGLSSARFQCPADSSSWLRDRCFQCLSKGHHAHSSRDPIRCRSCLHFGHTARFCHAKNPSHRSARFCHTNQSARL